MSTTPVSDIVSSTKDSSLPDAVSVEEARRLGRFGHSKPTPDNSVILLIDHQVGLLSGVRDVSSLSELKANILGLAEVAKALEIPVLLTSSNAQWQNGDLLPELRELFPDLPVIRRTGIINAYEDPTFRAELKKITDTGRDHVILAGVTIGTCATFPTLSLLNDGFPVFPVVDACGAWNRYEAEAAMSRMTLAGAELTTVFALACELQEDWKKPTANAMLAPFRHHLPEYSLVVDNFWNNYGQKTVPDPFA
ncbi:isochorismatase family protein [Streptomyces spongiae]|uniref:Isochorismatase family protein n=1 Tax=Streptomyces spongiae TaxID=565072 RepID=A0A5N8XBQ1_9ACTN|nr:isochorismatase family protein [Streptomyces spongiae]MPY56566.1 isochorismatase family protein [Streptomyces spongiae]